MIGKGANSQVVYIIDYGLAKLFRDPKTRQHIPYKDNKKLTGTARYASINTHLGVEQARRDDLECLGYTLIYLAKGGLPWQGVRDANKKQKYNKIGEKKMITKMQKLCEGLPPEFVSYMNYCTALGFEDKPDYVTLRKLFKGCFSKNGFSARLMVYKKNLKTEIYLL